MGKALELNEGLRISIFESLVAVTGKGINKKGEGELFARCPVHGEDNPSFSYNYNKDIYFCFSCGATGDLIKLWCLLKGFSNSKEGFVSFCREYGLGEGKGGSVTDSKAHTPDKKKEAPKQDKPKQPVKDLTSIFRQMPPLPPDWIRELRKKRGWSEEVIRKYDLRLQTLFQAKDGIVKKVFWEPNRIVIPIYDESGKVVNMRMYRPGPARNDNDPKIISWASGSGEARLFPAKPEPEGFILLCEGEPDDLCALSMGYNAITQTSKPKTWKKEQLDVFKGRDVVIAFDADLAGQTYMTEFAIPALEKVARSIKILEWPDYMGRLESGKWPNDHGQDLTDFIVKHGKSKADLDELIAEARPFSERKSEEIESEAINFFKRSVHNDRLAFKPRVLAERLMEKFDLIHDPKTGLLYKWNEEYWEDFNPVYLEIAAMKLLGQESDIKKINDAVNQVKIAVTIPKDRDINDRLSWLCVKNGMLDIKTIEFKPHDKDFLATFSIPVVYNPDSEKECTRFIQYLEQTIQTAGPMAQVQEFIGTCFDRTLNTQKCLVLLGGGSDGKTILIDLIREIVGEDNCAIVSLHELNDKNQRATLYQKSVSLSTEIGTQLLDTPYFKAIVTGDPINGCHKYGQYFSFKPYCKLVFAGNRMPKSSDNSEGYFRRLLPIKFKRRFHDYDPDRDPQLFQKLKNELSEIFHWAIVGLHRYYETMRFTQCDETDEELFTYRRQNNPVVSFIEECIEFNDGMSAAKQSVYESYRKFCGSTNNLPLSRERFFSELYSVKEDLRDRQVHKRFGSKRVMYIEGISVAMEEA